MDSPIYPLEDDGIKASPEFGVLDGGFVSGRDDVVKHLICTSSDFKKLGRGGVVVVVHAKNKRKMMFDIKREGRMLGGFRSFSIVDHGDRTEVGDDR